MNFRIVILLLSALLAVLKTGAQCVSVSGGNWTSPSNWSGCTGSAGRPGAADSVVINGHELTLNSSTTVAHLTLVGNPTQPTALEINANTLTVSNDVSLLQPDNTTDNDVQLNIIGTGSLQAQNMLFERDSTNNQNVLLRLLMQDNAALNITDDMVYDYQNGNENFGWDIQLEGNATATIGDSLILLLGGNGRDLNALVHDGANLSVGSAIAATKNGGQELRFILRDSANVSVTQASVFRNLDNAATLEFIVENSASFTGNSLSFENTNGAADLDIIMRNQAQLTITQNLSFTVSGGDDVNFNIRDTTQLSVGGNLSITKSGGDDFTLNKNEEAVINVTGNFESDFTGDSNGDNLRIDFNGGAVTVGGTFQVQSNDTNAINLRLFLDGTTLQANNLEFDVAAPSNAFFFLNNTSVNPCSLSVTETILINHDTLGSGIQFRTNENSVISCADFKVNHAGTVNNDDVVLDFENSVLNVSDSLVLRSGAFHANGQIFTDFTGSTAMVGTVYSNMNGDGTAVTDYYIRLNNTNSTTAASLTVSNDLVLNTQQGDNHYIQVNENSSLVVNQDLKFLNSSPNAGEAMNLQVEGGTVNIIDSFLVNYNNSSQNSDFALLLENGANMTASTIYMQFLSLDDALIRSNQASDLSTSLLTVSNNWVIETDSNANDVLIDLNNNSQFSVGNDFVVNYGCADGDDLTLNIDSASTFLISNDFLFNSSGNSDVGDHQINLGYTGSLSVTNDFIVNHQSGRNFNLYLNNNTGSGAQLSVGDSLVIQRSGIAEDVNIRLFNTGNSRLEVGTFYAESDADGDEADNVTITLDHELDSFLVNQSMVMRQNIAINQSDLQLDLNSGVMHIQGDLNVEVLQGDNLNIYLDNARLQVDGDANLTAGADFLQVFIYDTSTFAVGGDFNLNSTGTFVGDLRLRIRDNSELHVTDSLIVNHQGGDDVEFDIGLNNNSNGNVSANHLYVHLAAASNSFSLDLFEGSKVDIASNLTIENQASGGDIAQITLDDAGTDSLLIGGGLTINYTGGSPADADDFTFDQNGGFVRVAGAVSLTASGARNCNLQFDGLSAVL